MAAYESALKAVRANLQLRRDSYPDTPEPTLILLDSVAKSFPTSVYPTFVAAHNPIWAATVKKNKVVMELCMSGSALDCRKPLVNYYVILEEQQAPGGDSLVVGVHYREFSQPNSSRDLEGKLVSSYRKLYFIPTDNGWELARQKVHLTTE